MRSLGDRLRDIASAIESIEETAREGKDRFLIDKYRQVWVVYHLQIIGEAVRPAADQLRQLRPEYPWARIVAMRHILVHGYFGIDLQTVWAAVEQDLPVLKQTVSDLLREQDTGGTTDSLESV